MSAADAYGCRRRGEAKALNTASVRVSPLATVESEASASSYTCAVGDLRLTTTSRGWTDQLRMGLMDIRGLPASRSPDGQPFVLAPGSWRLCPDTSNQWSGRQRSCGCSRVARVALA
jgi:hypothetical protein